MWFRNGLLSIEDMKKAIKDAEEQGAEYIGIENKRLWYGKDDAIGFCKWTA